MATNSGRKPWGFFSDKSKGGSGKMVKAGFFKNKQAAQAAADRMGAKFDSQVRKRIPIKTKEIKGKV